MKKILTKLGRGEPTAHPYSPIIILLFINITIGLLTFRGYGLSWDEPLFYDYADSIKLAYTPAAFSPSFDFEQVYGPSATDHKYYGPAYLLVARPFEQMVNALGADRASAWHLVNFLAFQIGLVFFFLLLRRWFDPWPAALTVAFFAWQPVLWGHAFINPKDAPFMMAFLVAVTTGFWMVDSFSKTDKKLRVSLVALAGIALGAAVAVRVIGPLAGLVVFTYFLLKREWRAIPAFVAYGVIGVAIMFALWPFLWANPVSRMMEVIGHMSYNPTQLAVLFMGQMYRAATLPHRYFPQMLLVTLTEPTWILFVLGVALAVYKIWRKEWKFLSLLVMMLSWFGLMAGYVLLKKPPMYDGFRHFLFSIPPVFAMGGMVFQFLLERIKRRWLFGIVAALMLLPGVLGIARLYPYEYTYYNSFVGGTGGAYRSYETDYWLTCYKESLAWIRTNEAGKTIHIQREFPLAQYYGAGLNMKDLGLEQESDVLPGDILLFSTRADLDIRSIYRNLPVIHTIGRDGADYCLIKEKK